MLNKEKFNEDIHDFRQRFVGRGTVAANRYCNGIEVQ